MATAHSTVKQPKPLTVPKSDFYELARQLNAEELAFFRDRRGFMETKVAPSSNSYWIEDVVPVPELVPAFKAQHRRPRPMQVMACRGGKRLLFGLAAWRWSVSDPRSRPLRVNNGWRGLHLC